jgi:hypothetical protein
MMRVQQSTDKGFIFVEIRKNTLFFKLIVVITIAVLTGACGTESGTPLPAPDDKVSPASNRQPLFFVGIDANPPANVEYTPDAVWKSARMVHNAGKTFMHLAPKWNELEPTPGRYNFEELDFDISVARHFGYPIELGIRIIDTNQRTMPDAYNDWPLDDPRIVQHLNALLEALGPRLKGMAKWVTIGNEVDAYFDNRRDEIPLYVNLIKQILPTVKKQFGNPQFTINMTPGAIPRVQSDYAPLLSLTDFLSMTYYPLNPDFSVKSVERVKSDLETIIALAGKRKMYFQEIGCPSATRLNSSEAKQAEIFKQAFSVLKAKRERVIGVNIIWLSDIPDTLVDHFTRYYQLPNSQNFRAYLATLGLFDKNGKAKAAWRVFEHEAKSIART